MPTLVCQKKPWLPWQKTGWSGEDYANKGGGGAGGYCNAPIVLLLQGSQTHRAAACSLHHRRSLIELNQTIIFLHSNCRLVEKHL